MPLVLCVDISKYVHEHWLISEFPIMKFHVFVLGGGEGAMKGFSWHIVSVNGSWIDVLERLCLKAVDVKHLLLCIFFS